MIAFIYSTNGGISITLEDERLIKKIERDIVSEIKLASTDEKFERARDLIAMLLDYREAREESKKIKEEE